MHKYKKVFKVVFLDLLLLVLVAIGLDLRTSQAHKYLTINTASFFYERAAYLNENGVYPRVDETSSAPGIRAEDYPPGLAYTAVFAYRLISPFLKYNFYEFACVFPVCMYLITLLFGCWMVSTLYSRFAGIVFSALLSILPAAVKLTSSLYFTSESVGIFFFLLSAFFVIKIEEKPLPYTLLSIISVTFFNLTYQLFLPFLVMVAIIAVKHCKRKDLVLSYISVLLLPLAIGHFVAQSFLGIDYSPLHIFRELYIGITESKTEYYRLAMGRIKLKPTDLKGYTENFGWITIPLMVAGITECVRKIKKTSYLMPLLGCIIGLLLVSHYFKYRFIALPFVVVVSAIGWDFLYNLIKVADKPVTLSSSLWRAPHRDQLRHHHKNQNQG